MTKLLRLGATFGLILAAASPIWAEGESADTVVATVNGKEITLGQMIATRETLAPEFQASEARLFSGILDMLVQQEVVAQSAAPVSARDKANLANMSRGYLAGSIADRVATDAVTDATLKAAYDERFKDASADTLQYNVSHILVDSQEKAEALRKEIEAGASFATVARENSTDLGSGAAGGDLGWYGLGSFVKPFEEAMVAAEPGKVTAPVQSEFGWHLILVKETRSVERPTLDQLRDELAGEIEEVAIDTHVKDLMAKATIDMPGKLMDPALIMKSDLID